MSDQSHCPSASSATPFQPATVQPVNVLTSAGLPASNPPVSGLLEDLADRLLACSELPGAVYLYPHVSVDGDALGSALALGLALEQCGVSFVLPLDEAVPPKLAFLPALERICDLDQQMLTAGLSSFSRSAAAKAPSGRVAQQLALAIDCSGASRLGARASWYRQAAEQLVLDHHISERPTEPGYVVDTTAAAVGELVFELILILGRKTSRTLMNQTLAQLLMAAIMSDTGSFVYSNTTARSFLIAAQLMQQPLDLRAMTYELFDRTSTAKLRLRGLVFSAAEISHDGRIIYAAVDEPMMVSCQAKDHDLDGIIADLRNVSGIDAAFLVRCQPDGTLRVNIRSSEQFDAAAFAGLFGGGGHPRAAGMTLSGMTLAEAGLIIPRRAGECL